MNMFVVVELFFGTQVKKEKKEKDRVNDMDDITTVLKAVE
jgi:hypothetical protein